MWDYICRVETRFKARQSSLVLPEGILGLQLPCNRSIACDRTTVARSARYGEGVRCYALFAIVVWVVVATLNRGTPAFGQAISREYTLKAAFLYKFATYVRWPEKAFPGKDSPFVMCILGPDPVGSGLRRIAAVKQIDGRRIEVRNFERPEDVRECHILFMSRAFSGNKQKAAMEVLSGRNILFVGETTDFLTQGGVIDLVVQDNRLVFFVSKSACERENLSASAQLLRVAQVVN